MIILGIETSCDETAVGIVTAERRILANQIASQQTVHAAYGGVVPEIAARAHLQHLDQLVQAALQEAGVTWAQLDGFAATCGPGLIGGVMVGAMFGKALAAAQAKPFSAVNHLAAHALTARLTDAVQFPFVLLLISGGHSQLLLVRGVTDYQLLGTTLDDAVGECFDKTAKLLGLPYPGGPALEALAQTGDATRFLLPHPLLTSESCDFSFSGLKTAMRTLIQQLQQNNALSDQARADLAASLQHTLALVLAEKSRRALTKTMASRPTALVVAGGVAANQTIRRALQNTAAAAGLPLIAPPPALCTDNGVMVAWAGLERLRLGLHDPLDTPARPRWPLQNSAQEAG
jgi:N6-L-threonylcarbamoyladenine synthase